MTFTSWLNTFIQEKGIDLERGLEVEGPSGTNFMTVGIVVDAIKNTSSNEQAGIKNMIVKIDFVNGDVVDYFKHLAQAIAI